MFILKLNNFNFLLPHKYIFIYIYKMIDPDMEALAKQSRCIKQICRKCYASLPINCSNCRK